MLAILAAAGLSACGSSKPVEGASETPRGAPVTRYDMANACYALEAVGTKRYAQRDGDGAYAASVDRSDATPFFMKPTALGKYLFFSDNESMMAATGGTVGSAAQPGDAADWTVDTDAAGDFTVYSVGAARYLSVDAASGALTLASAPAKFDFVPARGCKPFPEIQTDAAGASFKGQGVDKPVLGFAEVHSHVSATSFLGGGHYGRPFHRFGVTQALGNCAVQHGPGGALDLVGNLMGGAGSPLATHETQGWPTFVDWPARDSLMHEAMYYKWIERAWLAGMRIMVNNVVENEVLCRLQSLVNTAKLSNLDLGSLVQTVSEIPTPQYCNEMESAISQVQYLRDMEGYIDAQEGGPGKGWFRIVTTPQQAREVINQGKLAVVLGIEISHLFNCKVSQPGGLVEAASCDKEEIDSQLDRLAEIGVRQMFPIHEFDNGLGGNGIFDGLILNFGNFLDTGSFWATYDCPEDEYFYGAGAHMTTSLPAPADPLTNLLHSLTQGLLPLYPSKAQCNARAMTDLGHYALERMMDKKMIIEVDHLELKMKTQLLDMADERAPVYPLVSTHGGHGGISMTQAHRLLQGGGLLYPSKGNGKQYAEQLTKLRPLKDNRYLFAMGYGADTNGLAAQSGPRGADAEPVRYPFTLFRGPGWGPQFSRVQPIVFDQSKVPEGNRNFDINAEGLAQYGMIADWVEEVRLEGGQQAVTDLYNSAEAYLQTWERTVNR
ncbi:peptidase M19 [Solimonas sp. K1W22B-7]|nr:peptidase M19 [Solimonas sp. K1W22B-7]